MDPITHLSSGVLGAMATRRWFPEAKFFMPFCMLAAWIPDGDIFFGNGDPEFSLLHHRGITTSFAGAFIFAALLALIYKTLSQKTSFIKTTALAYGLMLIHVWLDLITTYGTQIMAPFSNHRYALDGAFIIDPLFTGISLLLIIAAAYFKNKRQAFAILGMVWLFTYPLTNMGIGSYLEKTYAKQLDEQGITYDHVHVTPDALSPRFWKVVTTAGDTYLQDTIDLFSDHKAFPVQHFRRANNGYLEALGKQESMFATYAWFAKWPYFTERMTPKGKTVVFGDLRFTSTNPILAKIFKDRERPFTLTAHLDESGNLIRWTFIEGASSISETQER